MAYYRGLTFVAGFAVLAFPALATQSKGPIVLEGPAIIAIFEGKTVSGVYADGTTVRESYQVGGKITYWDPYYGNRTGQWSVVNNLFCTFYDGMTGGCFRVERVSENCFDYLAQASSEQEALAPTDKPRYTARAFIEGRPSTCPDEVTV
jgi:hypothetical protein